jgi:magnesium transporter
MNADRLPATDTRPQLQALAFESAARLMTANVLIVEPSASIADVRTRMSGRRYDCLSDIAVCDGRQLVGLLRVEDALAAPVDAPASEYMDADPPIVKHGVDQEVAAWKAVQHGEGALAVVDDDGQFLGLVPPQRLLAVLLAEHDEDMARVGGFLRGSAGARQASLEPTHLRLWHRLPWLFVGLLGAIAAAVIVDGFEGRLREEVLLAFFLPGVVYLADAVGTQTETLIIRGISVGVKVRDVVVRELVTGLMAGTLLGAAFIPVGLLWWHDADVVFAVSLALFFACSVATIVAMTLPWLFGVIGQDPAFGSGPLATVVQDLLSILLYFSVASLLV